MHSYKIDIRFALIIHANNVTIIVMIYHSNLVVLVLDHHHSLAINGISMATPDIKDEFLIVSGTSCLENATLEVLVVFDIPTLLS